MQLPARVPLKTTHEPDLIEALALFCHLAYLLVGAAGSLRLAYSVAG
jgi:hypothetical protein